MVEKGDLHNASDNGSKLIKKTSNVLTN